MAGKKGTVGNMDFLNRVTQNSKGAAKSVSQTLDKVGMSALWENDGKKKIEYIDISKMEGLRRNGTGIRFYGTASRTVILN